MSLQLQLFAQAAVALPGNDTFLPINFERDFATVMEVYNKTQKAAQAAKAAAK